MDDERAHRWREWMAAAQAGDTVSYEKLLVEMLPVVRGFVLRRLRDPVLMEDVVQNVFLSIHRYRHTYRAERPIEPWMYAIARNALIDATRVRSRRVAREISLEDDGVPEPTSAPEPVGGVGLSADLVAALAALPPNQRDAVEMVQLEGLTVAEAAMRAGVTKTALKVRAHRGYRALRKRLGALDWTGERGGGE